MRGIHYSIALIFIFFSSYFHTAAHANDDGIKSLTEQQALLLVEKRMGDAFLSLNGLTSINSDVAIALSAHTGKFLSLDGLTSIDEEVADRLIWFRGDPRDGGALIFLDGLTAIDEAVAQKLASGPTGSSLSMLGLRSIEKAVGKKLSTFKGLSLYLNTATAIDAETRAILESNPKIDIGTRKDVIPKSTDELDTEKRHVLEAQRKDLDRIANDPKYCQKQLEGLAAFVASTRAQKQTFTPTEVDFSTNDASAKSIWFIAVYKCFLNGAESTNPMYDPLLIYLADKSGIAHRAVKELAIKNSQIKALQSEWEITGQEDFGELGREQLRKIHDIKITSIEETNSQITNIEEKIREARKIGGQKNFIDEQLSIRNSLKKKLGKQKGLRLEFVYRDLQIHLYKMIEDSIRISKKRLPLEQYFLLEPLEFNSSDLPPIHQPIKINGKTLDLPPVKTQISPFQENTQSDPVTEPVQPDAKGNRSPFAPY